MTNLSMPTLLVNAVTYYLPTSNDDVKSLIRYAKDEGKKISLRGSAHSFPLIKDNEATDKYIYVMLSNMREITSFDKNKGIVTVQAGCNLGLDPNDPTKTSTVKNSLLYQLDPFDLKTGMRHQAPGWALPDLGGITHQTVGGFMATGSSGGTTSAAFEEAILSVDIIHHDGNDAVLKTFSRPTNNLDDPFYGVAFAHLGLMGIVVSATFQCIKGFNISGNEAVTHSAACSIDLFGDGDIYDGKTRLSLQEYFEQKNLYTRFMWWPQSTTDLVVLWQANAHEASSDWQTWKSNPYVEFPVVLGSMTPAEIATEYIFTSLANWPEWLIKIFGAGPRTREAIHAMALKLSPILLKWVLHIFEPTNKPPKTFQDIWWNGLPMDNQASDTYFPVWFTELWIPIEKTKEVMLDLQNFYKDPVNAGTFMTEIYATGSNDFWLSPAYGQAVVRVDIFWWGYDTNGTPEEYYTPFWELLAKYNFRPHWGKYLPASDGDLGVDYLTSQYAKWDDWKALRSTMDPSNIFLTDYWKDHLGLS